MHVAHVTRTFDECYRVWHLKATNIDDLLQRLAGDKNCGRTCPVRCTQRASGHPACPWPNTTARPLCLLIRGGLSDNFWPFLQRRKSILKVLQAYYELQLKTFQKHKVQIYLSIRESDFNYTKLRNSYAPLPAPRQLSKRKYIYIRTHMFCSAHFTS